MKIPILNIYYLLSYSWQKLDISESVSVGIDDYDSLPDLLARVFLNSFNSILKQGLEKSYIECIEEYPGIKGKIEFKESLNRNLFQQGKAICVFDQYSIDIPSNQIIKRVLFILKRHKKLNRKLHDKVNLAYGKLADVSDLNITLSSFSQHVATKNNRHYNLLLSIAKLILESLTLNQNNDESEFVDFLQDDAKMAGLFENFLKNFYKTKLPSFKVTRDNINWDVEKSDPDTLDLLPRMQTDIVLVSKSRKIIIDAKYYKDALTNYYDVQKFHSTHLYQLFSYTKNLSANKTHPLNANCEGILIYPSNGYSLNNCFTLSGHKIRIATVDLSKPWKSVESELLRLVQ